MANPEAQLQITVVAALRVALPGDAFVFATLNEEVNGQAGFAKVKRWLCSAISAIGWRPSPDRLEKATKVFLAAMKTEAALHGDFLNKRGRVAGVADLGIVYRGRIIWIELKTAADPVRGTKRTNQNSDQEAFQRLCDAAGAPYAVCRTLDEVLDFLQVHQVPLRLRAA